MFNRLTQNRIHPGNKLMEHANDVITNDQVFSLLNEQLIASYCWPWSDPNADGTLVNDVVIGDSTMPWEAKEGKRVAKSIPFWYQWAYYPGGINQVGSIYTAEGFEFEYTEIFFGPDLRYDPATDSLVGDPTKTFDPILKRDMKAFDQCVKNDYPELLTRGLRWCYLYLTDKEVERNIKELV